MPVIDRVALALVDRHALAGQDGLIDGRPAARRPCRRRDPLAGPDDHAIADGQCFGRDLDLGVVPDHARGPRIEVEQLADRALGSLEGERFQAFADQGDEDDLGRDEVLAQASRRDAGDRQGDVGADRPLEQRRQREVDHPPAADHRRQQGQRDAERPLPGTPKRRQHQVGHEQQADHRRHGHRALRRSASGRDRGRADVRLRGDGMPLSVVVVAMGRRRHAQPHLFRPIFPVQPRALRPVAGQPQSGPAVRSPQRCLRSTCKSRVPSESSWRSVLR